MNSVIINNLFLHVIYQNFLFFVGSFRVPFFFHFFFIFSPFFPFFSIQKIVHRRLNYSGKQKLRAQPGARMNTPCITSRDIATRHKIPGRLCLSPNVSQFYNFSIREQTQNYFANSVPTVSRHNCMLNRVGAGCFQP